MCSDSMVSDRIDPMMNAPNAGENPTFAAKTTIPKHRAKDTISNVSSLISRRAFFRNKGTR